MTPGAVLGQEHWETEDDDQSNTVPLQLADWQTIN
jgi:hypothetical protein